MAFKKITMDDIPPSLKKSGLTYQELNAMINDAFNRTKITKTSSRTTDNKIYLETVMLKDVESVILHNGKSELTYDVFNKDRTFSAYVQLSRALEDDEYVEIKYTIQPNNSDVLKYHGDHAYIREEIYATLIKILFEYAKLGKVLNK